MIERVHRPDAGRVEAGGRRGRVRVERGLRHRVSAGPPPRADAFMRVRLPGHPVGEVRYPTGVRRRGAAREPGTGKVEASPPEVNGTALAEEAAPKLVQHPVSLDQQSPESLGRIGVVRSVGLVLIEADRFGLLDRPGPDMDIHSDSAHRAHDVAIKVRHGSRPQRDRGVVPLAGFHSEYVLEKIEGQFDRAAASAESSKTYEVVW